MDEQLLAMVQQLQSDMNELKKTSKFKGNIWGKD
jgi:hypothetical protein